MRNKIGLFFTLVVAIALIAACNNPAGSSTKNGNFSLQISIDGSVTRPDGKISYGPNTAIIPLTLTGNNYQGSYEGEFNAKVTGKCNGTATYPVTFNVTATGTTELNFSVKSSIGMTMTGSCGSSSGGSVKMPPATGTRTFILPAKDGAKKIYEMPLGNLGQITTTFTLKIR